MTMETSQKEAIKKFWLLGEVGNRPKYVIKEINQLC